MKMNAIQADKMSYSNSSTECENNRSDFLTNSSLGESFTPYEKEKRILEAMQISTRLNITQMSPP